MTATIHLGDCREIIATLPDCSIDSIVTDPPYELGFMGKKWDASGIAYDITIWEQCLRVLKPGGHLLAFGGTRTYHRMTCAIEDSGFEIRDSIHWLYGSGFPKSHNVSLSIDKMNGHKNRGRAIPTASTFQASDTKQKHKLVSNPVGPYIAKSEHSLKWDGWGTALKPAHEPIVVARKPLTGTVAANVTKYGTGALNIDGARVGDEAVQINTYSGRHAFGGSQVGEKYKKKTVAGRWPANVITDGSIDAEWVRYFYSAKASKAERNAGLDHLDEVTKGSNFGNDGARPHTSPDYKYEATTRNTHPTVKPLALMRYLVRLVTPPGGTVLEPFAGSGTTLAAAILEGFDAIGCELTDDYLPIIEGRIAWAEEQMKPDPESLFNQ